MRSTGGGLYDGFDGDGETTHDDVTAFFEHLESDAVRENREVFDFDENGRIGFDDVTLHPHATTTGSGPRASTA